MAQEKTKEAARAWVEEGKPCTYQYGFTFKGAQQRPISNDEAMQKLTDNRMWGFGMGFYELRWTRHEGQDVLCFNEYSLGDME